MIFQQRGTLSRRGFLQQASGILTASGLPLWYSQQLIASVEQQTAATKQLTSSPNEQISMGAIGIGSPQSRGLAIYGQAKIQKGVRYVAACDVDSRHLERALNIMKRDKFTDAKGHKDFRDLLADKSIQAVTIATPDHWHALVAIEAMKRGKDVYCEKPLSLTFAEGQAMVKVAEKTGRIFQTGSQQRTEMAGRFRLAAEIVRSGRLGKISKVECRVGNNPVSGPITKVDPPKELDWNFWLGPTPQVDYYYMEKQNGKRKTILTNCHYEFRWWYAHSGGKMTDWGAHHLDIAQWALGMDGNGPISVEATSAPASKEPNEYDCHPNFEVTYMYENGTKLVAMAQGDNGVKFFGENGKWLFVSRGKIEASDPKIISEPIKEGTVVLYESRPTNHMANFIDCVRSRKKPICSVEIGHSSCTICHLGTIALRTGKKLKWDPKKHQFDDATANAMLSRPMRSPWKLEA